MLSSTLRIRSPRTEYRVIPMPQNSSEIRAELVQLRPEKGKVEANLGRIRETVERASGEVDLLVFPECAISGYFVEGGVEEVSRGASEVAAALGTPRHDAPDVVVGFYEKGRGPSYNSVGWFFSRVRWVSARASSSKGLPPDVRCLRRGAVRCPG